MPGRVVDLSLPGVPLPDPIVVDTNLLVERLLVPYLGALPAQATVLAERAAGFFADLAARAGIGIVTPTAFNEFVHVAIRFKYQQEQLNRGGSPRQWAALYKQDPTILRAFGPDLERLRVLFQATGLLFLGPEDLGPIASGRGFAEELVSLVGAYGLDSNDALILMEAARCGVTAVATLDADMRRAQADFEIHTWL